MKIGMLTFHSQLNYGGGFFSAVSEHEHLQMSTGLCSEIRVDGCCPDVFKVSVKMDWCPVW